MNTKISVSDSDNNKVPVDINLMAEPMNLNQEQPVTGQSMLDSTVPNSMMPNSAGGMPVNSENEPMIAEFSFAKYKTWFILLAIALIVFVGVIVAINKNNAEVEDKLANTNTEVEVNQDEIPNFFTASLLGVENEAPTVEDIVDSVASTDVETTDTDPVIDEDIFNFPDDFDFDSLNDVTTDPAPVVPVVNNPVPTNSQFDDLASLINSDFMGAANTDPLPADNLGLNSNTMPETLMASQVQGDTGPALWLALVPSLAYGLIRKKKK